MALDEEEEQPNPGRAANAAGEEGGGLEARIHAIEASGTFYLRLIALAVLWAGTTVLCITATLTMPLAAGRYTFRLMRVPWANDL